MKRNLASTNPLRDFREKHKRQLVLLSRAVAMLSYKTGLSQAEIRAHLEKDALWPEGKVTLK